MTKILIIEDDKTLRNNTSIFLEEMGYEVFAAEDGLIGVEKAIKHTPDLILCDIAMPNFNGYDVFNKLQENIETSLIPFIFITAKAEKEDIRNGMQLGADDYITKPYTYDDLFASIQARLMKHERIKKLTEEKAKMQRNKLIEESKQIIENYKNQNKEIKQQHKSLINSIEYAQLMQQALLPSQEIIKCYFPKSFVFAKPKAIVSGDFHWMEKKDNRIYFSVVDCTGHGVPGAFLSIVGFNILQQAINEENLKKPSEILDFLNRSVIEILHQKDESGFKEGMDLALCALDTETLILEYAGANNPVVIVRGDKLIIQKANERPIGIYFGEEKKPFTNNYMQLQKDDTIYLFSDGYADQFGGPNGKKFMKRRFFNSLIELSKMTCAEQKDFLEKQFNEWMGDNEQVDDVLVLGIKI